MAPDLERLARSPWPIASFASSGMRALSSALACSCSACAVWVRANAEANSAQAFEPLMPDGLAPKGWKYPEDKKSLQIGPFTVTPHLVDHSGFDAYGLEMEAGERGSSPHGARERITTPVRKYRCHAKMHAVMQNSKASHRLQENEVQRPVPLATSGPAEETSSFGEG